MTGTDLDDHLYIYNTIGTNLDVSDIPNYLTVRRAQRLDRIAAEQHCRLESLRGLLSVLAADASMLAR